MIHDLWCKCMQAPGCMRQVRRPTSPLCAPRGRGTSGARALAVAAVARPRQLVL